MNEPAADSADSADAEQMVRQALDEAQASMDQIKQVAADGVFLPDFDLSGGDSIAGAGIELLSDVDLYVEIELGRTEMLVEDVLKLAEGSVVELDKLAGDPVDVYVNKRLIARGEVLVLNDNFCIRISEIVANLEEQAESAAAQAESVAAQAESAAQAT
ncbi:MAG: flagellar motor switch protein FliN [Phycisphaeraceae bacterium]